MESNVTADEIPMSPQSKPRSRLKSQIMKQKKMRIRNGRITPRMEEAYNQFREEVAAGKFKATDDDLENLILVPHFEPVEVLVPSYPLTPKPASKKKIPPKNISKDKLTDIKDKSKNKSKQIYAKKMRNYMSDLMNQSISQDENNDSKERATKTPKKTYITIPKMDRDELEVQYINLEHNLNILIRQNEALNSHLLLLEKAKSQLSIQKNSLIEVTNWQRKAIDNHNKSLEGAN